MENFQCYQHYQLKNGAFKEYGTILGGLLAADDASPLFTGENKTALEKVGVDENVLNNIKLAKTAQEGLQNLINVLKLRQSSTYGDKMFNITQAFISAIENTKNIVEWFGKNNKKNNKKRSKKWSRPSSKPSF